jgi:hypothetical protein
VRAAGAGVAHFAGGRSLLCQAECASGIMPSVTAAPLHMTVTSAGTTVTRKRPGSADWEAGAACHCQWQWNGRDLRAGMRRALRLTARPPQLQPAKVEFGQVPWQAAAAMPLAASGREHSGSEAQAQAGLRPVRSPLAT